MHHARQPALLLCQILPRQRNLRLRPHPLSTAHLSGLLTRCLFLIFYEHGAQAQDARDVFGRFHDGSVLEDARDDCLAD
jgi:hypothetical protein